MLLCSLHSVFFFFFLHWWITPLDTPIRGVHQDMKMMMDDEGSRSVIWKYTAKDRASFLGTTLNLYSAHLHRGGCSSSG